MFRKNLLNPLRPALAFLFLRKMSARTYAEALDKLNSLQSNAAVIADIRVNWAATCHLVIPETTEYLRRAGYKPDDLNALNVIHIAGTKGKGLYTSPHLVAVRERIRINGVPISEEQFARYFFELWKRFERNPDRARPETPLMPAYFRFLTIMAFHVFLCEKVDATVLEVGIGGTYDSTNLVPRPRMTAITALGLDHQAILGRTLPEIAAQKAGIYKRDVPALTVQQPADALQVVRSVAESVGASSFSVIQRDSLAEQTTLGLAGDHQIDNASLALAAVRGFLQSDQPPETLSTLMRTVKEGGQGSRASSSTELSTDALMEGLQKASLPGRCQTIQDTRRPDVTWHLDGAHTIESLECCGCWFARQVARRHDDRSTRILLFNCTSDRIGAEMLQALVGTLSKEGAFESGRPLFDRAIFSTNTTYASGQSKSDLVNAAAPGDANLQLQHGLAASWAKAMQRLASAAGDEKGDPKSETSVCASIAEAVQLVESLPRPAVVLATGSLHLVGGVMAVAELL